MIKHINHRNFLTTAFVATKKWELQNVDNDDVVLLEPIDSAEIGVAVDYIDYTNGGVPVVNTDCDIALEQQDADKAIYQEGATGSGIFYPDSEPQNNDGTFKRLVYDQTHGSFYNKRGNPIQMFGMDYIDFQLGKTERHLSDSFRIFTIPRNYFGERIVGNSVYLYDEALDDNVEIHDDGFQNLKAGSNLFSKVQEVRGYNLPNSFLNIIMSGSITNGCPELPEFHDYVYVSGSIDGIRLSVSFSAGTLVLDAPLLDISANSVGFFTGSLVTAIIENYGSNVDTGSYNVSFYTGSIFNEIISISGSNVDTGSLIVGFYTGSLV